IRHFVCSDLEAGGWRIAVLYAANTAGAALGCFLTDFLLVPASGLRGAQLTAVFFNVVAAAVVFVVAGKVRRPSRSALRPLPSALSPLPSMSIPLTSLALAMSGFAAMGMEIVWFRHVSILLGGFRAVFSLLLTVILAGIGVGSLASSVLLRRTAPGPAAEAAPARWLMMVQALFVMFTLIGLAGADGNAVGRA